ncbi:TPA: glycosyltransferase family 2 protein [Vibrio cholerae]|uniref:glycosyltransferase family 2 protein n=2 Tax=Vibrio cholerae TaxID=666 RepID=UPI00163CB90B|nr:glycosyltransferase family A protein [Vibrio cholerae]
MSSPISGYSAPKVSVIMPVYNTELYVERAMISLMEQTLDDVQFIIIDDGSKDNSLSIIKEVITRYPTRKDQITLLSRENRGVAATRAQGMELATGDYVIHLDSDDWAERNWLEAMYSKAIEDNADVVVCDYYLAYNHGNKKKIKQKVFSTGVECVESLFKGDVCNSNWNKMVKLKIIKDNNITFLRNINVGEDALVSLKVFYFSSKVSYLSLLLYNYNQENETSLTRKYTSKSFSDIRKVVDFSTQFLLDNNSNKKYLHAVNYLKLNVRSTILNCSTNVHDKKQAMNLYPETNFLLFKTKRLLRLKLYFLLYKLGFLYR